MSVSIYREKLYEYGQRHHSEGNSYACGCDEAKVKKLRFSGKACEHRGQSFEKNLEIWNGMISKKYGEGEYVIRLRGDMTSLDYSLRDPNIFRVIEHPHPLTGSRYSVWPTYDFEVVVEHEYDWSLLFAVNRKLLDPLSKRLMFVPDPIALHVKDAPSKRARIPYHPEKDLGSRTIQTSGFFFVPKRDALAAKAGTVLRLIELYNVQVLGKKTNLITAQFHSEEVIQDIPKIQWVTDLKTKLNVLEPGPLYNEDGSVNRKSLVTTKGLVEESFRDLSLGQIIQFIRYGFCRVDSRDTCVLAHK